MLQLSRATLRKIQQNMWWAAGYNLIGIPLAAGAALPFTGLALTPSLSGGLIHTLGCTLSLELTAEHVQPCVSVYVRVSAAVRACGRCAGGAAAARDRCA